MRYNRMIKQTMICLLTTVVLFGAVLLVMATSTAYAVPGIVTFSTPDRSSITGFPNGTIAPINETFSYCYYDTGNPADASTSTVSVSPAFVTADGTSTSTITVYLNTSDFEPASGKAVTLTADSGSSVITPVNGTTDANGMVKFYVKDTRAERVNYTAKDTTDGVVIMGTVTVEFTAGTPTASNSTVTASPASVASDGVTASTVTVTLKDAYNNGVRNKAVTLAADSGSSNITMMLDGTTDIDGKVRFKVTDTVPENVTYRATDTTEGFNVTQTAVVNFTAGTPMASNSTVTASPASVTADGTTTSTVMVTLKDAHDNAVSGKAVTLAANSGSSVINTVSGTTDANGQATFSVKDTKAESVTYTATDTTDGVTLTTKTVSVSYTAGTPTASNSTVTASPASVASDGVTASTVTVTLKDAYNNVVSGKTVTLTAGSGSSNITTVNGTTDANGQATFTVTDTVLENVTYRAKDTTEGFDVIQTAGVNFTAGTPTASNSTVTASPASVTADGTTTSTITVTLKDAHDNVVSGKTVTLAANSGSSVINTVNGTTDANGQATFTVKDTKAESVTYTATDTTDNVTLTTKTVSVSYTAGTPTASNSTVTASPASVASDGVTASTVTVTLKDAYNNVVSSKTVTLAAGSGSSNITTVNGTTDANGQATFTVTDTVPENVTYRATDATEGFDVTQTAVVNFTAPAYSVTYDGNGSTGGTVPVDNNTYSSGINILALDNTGNLTKTGCIFAGWNTRANGSGTTYQPADSFSMGSSNITLYAKWRISTVLTIDTASLPDAVTGTLYNARITASGGDVPYSFSITAGSLPPGILFAADGTVSGTPSSAGVYNITVKVTDGFSRTAVKSLTITVSNPSGTVSNKNDKSDNTNGGGTGVTTDSTAGTSSSNTSVTGGNEQNQAAANGVTSGGSNAVPVIVDNTNGNSQASVTAPDTTSVVVKPTLVSSATATASLSTEPIYVDTYINLVRQPDMATGSTNTVGAQSVSQVVVDAAKLDQRLAASEAGSVVVIPVNVKSDVITGQLDGQMVQSMVQKQAVLNIQTPDASYTIPSSQFKINEVAQQLGHNVNPADIKVNITISKVSSEATRQATAEAKKNSALVVVLPVKFEVTCLADSKTVGVEKFNVYVERTIAIPDIVDPSKITTAVVINSDGTESHIPTHVTMVDGHYYAQINSLTNSTYLLVWHPVSPKDSQKNWARKYINEAASRMIIDPVKKDTFSPNTNISRAEFIDALIKGLGLKRTGKAAQVFRDVPANSTYANSISVAVERGIVIPDKSGKFNPKGTITKEEAMVFMCNALKLTGQNTKITANEASKLIGSFKDGATVSKALTGNVGVCIREGVTDLYTNGTLMPKLKLTRAQAAVMIIKLLAKSKLI